MSEGRGECILFFLLVWNWCWRERGRIEGGSRGPSWKSIERRKKPEEQEEESRPVRKERKKALSPLTAIHRNTGYPTGVVVRKPRKNQAEKGGARAPRNGGAESVWCLYLASLENGHPTGGCLQTGGCQISFIFPRASVRPMPPADTAPPLRFSSFLIPEDQPPSVIDARKLGLRAFFFLSFLFFCSCCSFGEVCLVIICNRNSFLFLRFDILIPNRNLFNLITIYRNRVCHNFLLIILKYL